MQQRQRSLGFTLIEVMIVVAIIGILAAIAYPSYQNQVQKTRRADAKSSLMELAQGAERFYSQNGTYDGYEAELPFEESPRESGTKFYDLEFDNNDQTFALSAEPKNGQEDDGCGILTINQIGAKEASEGTNENCWAR
jgi:type IV pilus assembly protein PilE